MVRVAISVEGFCEEDFIKQTVAPHLRAHGVFATPIVLQTSREASGRKHKGGAVSVARVASDLERILPSFDHVTTFYDFYGFEDKKATETADQLAARIAMAVGAPRTLRAYVQMHEFEALLFAEPIMVGDYFKAEPIGREVARAVQLAGGPENVDDSPRTAPSKRLEDWCLSHSDERYNSGTKRRHGPRLAEKIGLTAMRAACPRFAVWLAGLETLG